MHRLHPWMSMVLHIFITPLQHPELYASFIPVFAPKLPQNDPTSLPQSRQFNQHRDG
jgi:hypothetical protein